MTGERRVGLRLPPTPTRELDELIAVARRFGRDTEYSRAGGGNASVKMDGVLYIKPSGMPLADLDREALVPLDMVPLLALLDDAPGADVPTGIDPVMQAALAARLAEAAGRRPSVELLFHTILPERFVLHTHPISVNAVTCNRDGAALCERLFGDQALWVPYTDPGLPLARAIADRRHAFEQRVGRPAPRITLLQNHGLIVAADEAAQIDELSAWVMATIQHDLQRVAVTGEDGAPDSIPHPRPGSTRSGPRFGRSWPRATISRS